MFLLSLPSNCKPDFRNTTKDIICDALEDVILDHSKTASTFFTRPAINVATICYTSYYIKKFKLSSNFFVFSLCHTS